MNSLIRIRIRQEILQATRTLDRQPLVRVFVIGVLLGLGFGIPGFVYLRSPAWMLLWVLLFAVLWRIAAYAEPVFAEAALVSVEARPKRVRDGPLHMVELPGGQFHMGSPQGDTLASDRAIGSGSSAGCVTGVPTATACPRKLSGNTPAALGKTRCTPLAMTLNGWETMPGLMKIPLTRGLRSGKNGPTPGDCTTCMALSGNAAFVASLQAHGDSH